MKLKRKPEMRDLISIAAILTLTSLFVWVGFEYTKAFGLADGGDLISSAERLREFILSYGNSGLLIMVSMHTLQVVISAIPSVMVQFVGGLIYGMPAGILTGVVGIALGTAISFYLARFLGRRVVTLFVSEAQLEKLEDLISGDTSSVVLLILYILPLPKDFFAYFLGLTRIKATRLFLISALGRMPGILTATYLGAHIFDRNYALIIGVAVVSGAVGLLFCVFRRRILNALSGKPTSPVPHHEKPGYGSLARFCRSIVRLFGRKFKTEGDWPEDPVVYVGHHQNLKGVLRVVTWLDIPLRTWALWNFCHFNSCYKQYQSFTLTQRLHWHKIPAAAVSFLLALFVPKLMKSLRVIPVYRSSAPRMRDTIRRSITALENGESLLIFPDTDYASNCEQIGNMYTGFVMLDKFYHAKTGRHIDFIPILTDTREMRISPGKASTVRDGESYAHSRIRVTDELRNQINTPLRYNLHDNSTNPTNPA